MSMILAVRGVLPDHVYDQEEITRSFAAVVNPPSVAVLDRLHQATTVRKRHLAMPLADYDSLRGFGDANDVFIDVAVQLGERAITLALAAAGLEPDEVDLVMFVSVTGIAAPSIDARLVQRLGLRPDVRRLPIFGLGCVAGAAGIARVDDWLRGRPDGVAVLLSVELCSLTLQRDDPSMANLVGSGLFGDGAAAVVMVGEEHRLARTPGAAQVVDSRSSFYPDTDRVMGWDIGGGGFRIVLAPTVPDVVDKYLRDDVDPFLADHGLTLAHVGTVVAHPGGPKVIDAIQRSLQLPEDGLDVTRACLSDVGNLSSASVLHVLERTLAGEHPRGLPVPGSPGLLFALGPGFCSEVVLLRW